MTAAGKIYTTIFWFFGKKFVNIMRPVSNERSGDLTFYRGIHEFLESVIF